MKYKEYKISEIFTADETIVPDPSIIKQKKSKKNLDYYSFVPSKRVISSLTYNFVIILKNFRDPC